MTAVLKASKWLDEFANRPKASEVLGGASYVNALAADIAGRLAGTYDLGAGLPEKVYKGDQMVFFRDGEVNSPRRSYAVWFMAQYQWLGLIKEAPPYMQLADSIILTDAYEKAATAAKIDVPDDDMAPFEVKLDGVTFDPAKPEEEVKRT